MKRIFLVHSWEIIDDLHRLHIWEDDKEEEPETKCFKNWSSALEAAYIEAEKLGLDYFQVDHPDFPHKFIKIMRVKDVVV